MKESDIEYISNRRIPLKKRKKELFYYEVRGRDDDWGDPATIEKSVVVNYCYTLVLNKKLIFPKNRNYLSFKQVFKYINWSELIQ